MKQHVIRIATLGCCALLACSAGTGGELVEIEVQLAVRGQGKRPPGRFETSTGFTVDLKEATLALESMLVYAPDDGARLSLSDLFMSRARAHGGYDPFNGRIVRVEVPGPVEVDLLAEEPVSLGSVIAETGPMDSATLIFADEIEGAAGQGFVRGTAIRDDETFPFEGTLHLEDEPLLRRVDGIAAKGELEAGGTLTFTVRPDQLFDEAHFDRLEESEGGPRKVTSDTQVHTAWLFGARSTQTYSTKWRKP